MSFEQDDLGKKPKNIRSQNRQLIIDLYRQHEELTVTSISDMIGLSRTTVMKINTGLLERGIITEAGKGESTADGGKKPNIFRFNKRKRLIITYYIKHTSILFRLYDLAFNMLEEDTKSINQNARFQDVIRKMQTILKRNILDKEEEYAGSKFLACMVGVHGNVDVESGILIQSTHFSAWGTNKNIVDKIRNKLELDCPVFAEQWIRLKTYGENRLGIVGSQDSIIMLDAGWHGVVAGILLGGNLYLGKHYLSGEIGHFLMNPEEKEQCHCGSYGCFEQQISIKRLKEKTQKLLPEYPESSLHSIKSPLELYHIFQAADSGDVLARVLLDEIIIWFSRVISYLLLFFDPETLYIEGDYASGCRYFEQGITNQLKKIALPRIKRNKVIQFNVDGSDAVLKGSAILAVDKYFEDVTKDS